MSRQVILLLGVEARQVLLDVRLNVEPPTLVVAPRFPAYGRVPNEVRSVRFRLTVVSLYLGRENQYKHSEADPGE